MYCSKNPRKNAGLKCPKNEHYRNRLCMSEKHPIFKHTKTSNMKVGLYTRISRDSSDNTNQLLLLRAFCKKMGYEILMSMSILYRVVLRINQNSPE